MEKIRDNADSKVTRAENVDVPIEGLDSPVTVDSPTRFHVFMSLNLISLLLFVALRKYIYYRIDLASPVGTDWGAGLAIFVSIFSVNPLCLILSQIVNWIFRRNIKKHSKDPFIARRRTNWLWAMSLLWVVVAGFEVVVALAIIYGPWFKP
jgi:hypothetical protein